MTNFSLERFAFTKDQVNVWGQLDPRHRNWPVVYIMNNAQEVYVGESLNAHSRMAQHLTTDKQRLEWVRVVLDQKFNKSVCLDLESYLISLFSGDGQLQVLNSNAGITDADYFEREKYQETFDGVFEALRDEKLFQRTLPEIINSDLFKLSPFKALNHGQAVAVEGILEGLFQDLGSSETSLSVVQGNPGTGKTIVAIYLLKLLEDILHQGPKEIMDTHSMFTDFFTEENQELLRGKRVGLVVPQQSLRNSISKVFRLTPGLHKDMAMTAFDVGHSEEPFDLLIVDEAHRLNHRANQSSGMQNKHFRQINEKLFGVDDPEKTQLDWLLARSKHVILMLDAAQSVRPADLPQHVTTELVQRARQEHRLYPLVSQMRIKAGQDFVGYVRAVLSDTPPEAPTRFEGYDVRFFEDLGQLRQEIFAREREVGLARMVAGYAWKWVSKKDPAAYDIVENGVSLRWNSTPTDWISTPSSVQEVGSIHTVQGYDLNYAGVIIGKDLQYDPARGGMFFSRDNYFDAKGTEDNKKRGIKYTDEDILQFIRNIYGVLLTRGIKGTYLYVCDPALREYLRPYFTA